MLQSSTSFPPNIKELTGKELKLKIQICEDNIKSGSRLFYVIDAYDSTCTTSTKSDALDSGYKGSSLDDVSTLITVLIFIFIFTYAY